MLCFSTSGPLGMHMEIMGSFSLQVSLYLSKGEIMLRLLCVLLRLSIANDDIALSDNNHTTT